MSQISRLTNDSENSDVSIISSIAVFETKMHLFLNYICYDAVVVNTFVRRGRKKSVHTLVYPKITSN